MPTPTYIPLATLTLAANDSVIEFTSIPATYRDLILIAKATATNAGCVYFLQYNGVTTSSYSEVRMGGNGSSALSDTTSNVHHRTNIFADIPTTGSNITTLQIMDYSATDKHKTTLMRSDNSSQGSDALAGRFASTSAISSIKLSANVGSFTTGSTFSLYGVN